MIIRIRCDKIFFVKINQINMTKLVSQKLSKINDKIRDSNTLINYNNGINSL